MVRVGQCFSGGNLISPRLVMDWLINAPLCALLWLLTSSVRDCHCFSVAAWSSHLGLATFNTNEELECRTAVERSDFVLILFFERGSTAGPLPLYMLEHRATVQAIDQMKKCCQPLEVWTIKRHTYGRRIQAQPCMSLEVRGRLFYLHRPFELI